MGRMNLFKKWGVFQKPAMPRSGKDDTDDVSDLQSNNQRHVLQGFFSDPRESSSVLVCHA